MGIIVTINILRDFAFAIWLELIGSIRVKPKLVLNIWQNFPWLLSFVNQ